MDLKTNTSWSVEKYGTYITNKKKNCVYLKTNYGPIWQSLNYNNCAVFYITEPVIEMSVLCIYKMKGLYDEVFQIYIIVQILYNSFVSQQYDNTGENNEYTG